MTPAALLELAQLARLEADQWQRIGDDAVANTLRRFARDAAVAATMRQPRVTETNITPINREER